MNAVRKARLRQGFSQRRLATRAGLSFRGLQLLESSGHDPRLSSLAKVSGALDLPEAGIETLLKAFFQEPARSFRSASLRILQNGFDSWPLHLFDAVDAFRQAPDMKLIADPPIHGVDLRLAALIASTVESICNECSLASPLWCRSVSSLNRPWFVSEIENLKASALAESSVYYRQRNIFVLANFLDRV